MAITGASVGFGMAPTNVFLGRVRSAENLIYRTAERQQNRPYREVGRRAAKLSQDMELFMSVPRAACFAVTFRVGGAVAQYLPGFAPGVPVIDELLNCLDLFTKGEEEQLRDRIPEDAYFRNFVGLARNLQPDGEKVSMVGFTTVRQGNTKQVAMTKAGKEHSGLGLPALNLSDLKRNEKESDMIHLRGQLIIANATKKSGKQSGEIEIVTEGNVRVKIVVPPGLMSDIVRPLWELEVEVTGTQRGQKVHLIQIREAS